MLPPWRPSLVQQRIGCPSRTTPTSMIVLFSWPRISLWWAFDPSAMTRGIGQWLTVIRPIHSSRARLLSTGKRKALPALRGTLTPDQSTGRRYFVGEQVGIQRCRYLSRPVKFHRQPIEATGGSYVTGTGGNFKRKFPNLS